MLYREQKKETMSPVRKEFTQLEIDSVRREVTDWTKEGRTAWLLKKNAIKLPDSKGYGISVIQNADGSFPYTELALLWERAKYSGSKSMMDIPSALEGYDKMAESMTTQSLL